MIHDLLIHSSSHEEHVLQLYSLLAQLCQYGIKINLPKCEFGSKEVTYLGF